MLVVYKSIIHFKFVETQSWTIPSKNKFEIEIGDKKTSITQRRHWENPR